MQTPELTLEEWRYIQRQIGMVASADNDEVAESIRTKLYHALGTP